jgi:DNA-binding CsgD family transcriptional regulator
MGIEKSHNRRLLSPREQQVTELYMQGVVRRDIAVQLGLARQTVSMHLSSVRKKMGLKYAPQIREKHMSHYDEAEK